MDVHKGIPKYIFMTTTRLIHHKRRAVDDQYSYIAGPWVMRASGKQKACHPKSMSATIAVGSVLSRLHGLHDLLQLSILMHPHQNVRTSNKFAVDEHLRDGGPAGELLDPFTKVGVCQDISAAILESICIQDSAGHVTESALGCCWRSLHVNEHIVTGDILLDLFLHVRRWLLLVFGFEVFVRIITGIGANG